MRGRRRGRNRPSPLSPPTGDGGTVTVPAGQGSATMVEESPPAGTDSGDHESTDPVVTPNAEADSPTISGEDPGLASTEAEKRRADADATVVQEAADSPTVTSEAATAAPAAEVVAAVEDMPKVGAPAEEDTANEETDAIPSSPGRLAQSASANPLPRVLAVANQKGGVGKTTTSVNLGAALAELGFRVLVIDLDPQGNATTGLGIDARNFELSMYDVLMRDCSLEDCVEPTSMKNLFVAPATIALAGAEIELVPAFSRELKLKRAIESVIEDFDYVLIDCPPSLGLITVNALAAASEVLVPIQCEYYALEGLSQLMRNVHLVASNLNPQLDISTIVLTMYDARTKLADQVATEVRQHFGSKVCRIVIPRTVRLSEAPSFGQPITAFDPASRGAIAYRELAKEVSGGTS